MTTFAVNITDMAQLEGITWAREQYNASVAPPAPPPDTITGGMSTNGTNGSVLTPMATTTPPFTSDDEYVQWVMEQAAISYADQRLRAEHRQNYEDAAAAAGRSVI